MYTVLFHVFLVCFLSTEVYSAAFPRSTTESFIIHYLEDKRLVQVKVELNQEQQTEHVISNGGETLYDFNQRKVAYKDVNSSQCFIADVVGESLERDRRRLRNLRNGTVRSFYLPTFIIQEEFINEADALQAFGVRIANFCSGCVISSLAKHQQHRRKRNAPEEKGQFTHHSYGHYGHQSNNYAHYGQETYITGAVDKDGNLQNQRVLQQQIRSEGSQTYPGQDSRNALRGPIANLRTDVRNPQFQAHSQIPSYQQISGNNKRPFNTGATGQFSLQTAQESSYQLNLPLGLKAGNTYKGGVRSGGHYGVGGSQPHITTDYQKYPESIFSGIHQPSPDQTGQSHVTQQFPSMTSAQYPQITSAQTGHPQHDRTRISDRGEPVGVLGYPDSLQRRISHGSQGPHDAGISGLPIYTQPGMATVPGSVAEDPQTQLRGRTPGMQTADTQTDSRTITSTGRHFVAGYDSPGRTHIDRTNADHRIPSSSQMAPSRGIQPGIQSALHPPEDQRITHSTPDYRIPSFQPNIIPSTYIPGGTSHISLPGQVSNGIVEVPRTSPNQIGLPGQIPSRISAPTEQATGAQPYTGISRNGDLTSGLHPDLRHHQHHESGSTIPSHLLQTPGIRHSTGPYANGNIPTSHIPNSYQPPPPSSIQANIVPQRQDTAYIPSPGLAPSITGTMHTTPGSLPKFNESRRNGEVYPSNFYPYGETSVRPQNVGIPSGGSNGINLSTGVRPGDIQYSPPVSSGPISQENIRGYQQPRAVRQGETVQVSSAYPFGVPSLGIPSEVSPADRTVLSSQMRPEMSRQYSQDSASSQTQIQTNVEGTAAEATSAGQYQGLGSQTQVRGGYVGNGSFSAQAQSGFTGGVVLSQVTGGKQGGLSGSSAQVERVGSAQSQVQIGQPSGSASSTAQGKFSGGVTQVQAQSSKSGGSAGAQAQSSGLSSSHVQVNIGGKEIGDQDRFQGTISASVHGGHLAGQSQTQLQGGYDSGRTYAATAQGGFDSSLGFQGSVPIAGSLPNFKQASVTGQQPEATRYQESQNIIMGSSRGLTEPASFHNGRQMSQTTGTRPEDQTARGPGFVQPTIHEIPSSTLPDQREPQLSTRSQTYLIPPGRIPQEAHMLHTGRTQTETVLPGSQYTPGIHQETLSRGTYVQYPSSIPEAQRYLPHSSVSTGRHPYPGHQTSLVGVSGERQSTINQGFPSYSTQDQNLLISSGTPSSSQWPNLPHAISRIPGQQVDTPVIYQPSYFSPGTITDRYQPGLGTGLLHLPETKQPPSFLPKSQQPIHQQYEQSSRIPVGYTSPVQQPSGSGLLPDSMHSTHFDSRYSHGYPPVPVQQPSLSTDQMTRFTRPQPGLQQGMDYTPSLIPGQPQISPRSHTIPSYSPSGTQILTKPDGSHYTGLQQRIDYPSSLIPGQPQISPQHYHVIPSYRPHETPILTKPDDSLYTDLQSGTHQQPIIPEQSQISPPRTHIITSQSPGGTPVLMKKDDGHTSSSTGQHFTELGQPQISPPKPQIPFTPETVPTSRVPLPSTATHTTQAGLPGVSEPDRSNCCEALRDLKRRCCDKQNRSSESSCCKSKTHDFDFDFSSDDLDDSKTNEPCKVVKAICYIVYKPVGKARVCKPTHTNGCRK